MSLLRTVTATRYVTPLREGGSLPALVEADDCGLYVLKFRGAGQGVKALIAELVAGELARAAGLAVPEIVLMDVDADLARTEPDAEIQDLLRASAGLNLALDFLPGSVTFDPLAHAPDSATASAIVWHDAFVANVDRSARNSNLLVWHGRLWLIDHGAALVFHHQWAEPEAQGRKPFPMIGQHVLLPWATAIEAVDARLAPTITEDVVEAILAAIPDAWLEGEAAFTTPQAHRAAYRRYFSARLAAPRAFVQEAIRAAAGHL